jgi:hypothetical protein
MFARRAQVGLLNENLRIQYQTAFGGWSTSVLAGRIPNTNPPQPPRKYVIAIGEDGWAYPNQGSEPVCDLPPIPTVPPPYTPPVLPEPANVRNVPAGDSMPVGYVLTAADGSRWQKQTSPTPFGVAYFYARVA